jgi:hypothetical protein
MTEPLKTFRDLGNAPKPNLDKVQLLPFTLGSVGWLP